ncbi:hypothetical protein ACIGO9_28525 [Nocardia asteroides]|uniref:hypothetical protein n=1 Tax=Nocardia asteroides TaxID=1824 RepID=UPI0037C8A486
MTAPTTVRAATLDRQHIGMTLLYYPDRGKKQRRARILDVQHASTYTAVTVQTSAGRGVVAMRFDEQVSVEP